MLIHAFLPFAILVSSFFHSFHLLSFPSPLMSPIVLSCTHIKSFLPYQNFIMLLPFSYSPFLPPSPSPSIAPFTRLSSWVVPFKVAPLLPLFVPFLKYMSMLLCFYTFCMQKVVQTQSKKF